jgi:hypothetical protein
MEYDKVDYQNPKYEAGYSEKQSALDTEIQAGGWRNLRKFSTYTAYSRQERIFLVYQAVSNSLQEVVSTYLISPTEEGEADGILTELKKLRMIQDILLNCLLWEPKGQLEKDMVPKEVWDLIK